MTVVDMWRLFELFATNGTTTILLAHFGIELLLSNSVPSQSMNR